MKIRNVAFLAIILTNLFVTVFCASIGIVFVNRNMNISLETDLNIMAELSDAFLSNELYILKTKAEAIARNFEDTEEAKWHDILAEQKERYPVFIGAAIFDYNTGLVASSGETTSGLISDHSIQRAFSGDIAFSSTYQTNSGTYIFLSLPLVDNKILMLTLPGQYFSRCLADFSIWETGHIFISDIEGFPIANPRTHWVDNRMNMISMANTDASYSELAAAVTLMTEGRTGITSYTLYSTGYSDFPRVCSYRPISSSGENWSLGVVAPLPENPIRNTGRWLLLFGAIGFVLTIIFAIFASKFINKPFDTIKMEAEEAERRLTIENAALDSLSRMKSVFLTNMSHEMKTPLSVISVHVQQATALFEKSGMEDNAISVSLRRAQEEILRLSRMAENAFDLASMQENQEHMKPFNIDTLLMNSVEAFHAITEKRGNRLNISIDDNLPQAYGNADRLMQATANILSNANEHTQNGVITVFAKLDRESRMVTVTIKDNGEGIESEILPNIFERGVTNAGRTGIGLPICKNIIEAHGGTIQIESELGKGTEVMFTIPILEKHKNLVTNSE